MKKAWLCVLLILGVAPGFSQPILLANDQNFGRTVERLLRFPTHAQQVGQSIRVYVGFTITGQGRVSEVSVSNKGPIADLLREEVMRVWAQLPSQNPRYAGRYVMPIAFLLGEGGSKRVKEIANKDDSVVQAGSYQLINEVSVIGFSACEYRTLTGIGKN